MIIRMAKEPLQRIEGCGWRLIYVPGIKANFFAEERCVDFRKFLAGSNNFKKGQRIYGHFLDQDGRCFELEVLEGTKQLPLGAIPADIRNEWGKAARPKTSMKQMFDTMKQYYPDITLQTEISINFLRLARDPEGHPLQHRFPNDLRPQTEAARGRG